MNERIQELALQAREYATTRHPVSNIILSVNSDLFEQKFAELIVKECMDCSSWVGKMNTNSVEPVNTAHAINQRIKKHFGVEE